MAIEKAIEYIMENEWRKDVLILLDSQAAVRLRNIESPVEIRRIDNVKWY